MQQFIRDTVVLFPEGPGAIISSAFEDVHVFQAFCRQLSALNFPPSDADDRIQTLELLLRRMPDAIKARFPPRLRTLLDSTLPFFHIPVDAPIPIVNASASTPIVNTSASTAGLAMEHDDSVAEGPQVEDDVDMEQAVANLDADAPPA